MVSYFNPAWVGHVHPVGSAESLAEAVRKMDVRGVEQSLAAGASVNNPINREGHTILDLFVAEHAAMIDKALEYQGQPGEVTQMFVQHEEAAFQVMRLLVAKGAVLSANSAVLKPGLK
mmetsp:Transcript_26388/g.49602  ORF Transcript_26388/g.49602 Transcript_26388/m.49602 type:complete len:118 (+) Transcript_26388:87-440(+)